MKTCIQFLTLICVLFWIGCTSESKQTEPFVLATTNIIADGVSQIVGDEIQVKSLMGPGVDPHLYKPLQGDISLLENADLIVHNGLHLEGKLSDILNKLAENRPVVAVSEPLNNGQLIFHQNAADPHVWFDISLWELGLNGVYQKLCTQYPDKKEVFTNNWNNYRTQMKAVHSWVKEQIETIPQQQRVMVTAHDAFHYFGRAYGIEVRALQGISTLDEFSLSDINREVEYLTQNKIPCVFVESSVPDKYMQSVLQGCKSKGHPIKIAGTLFSDAIGAKGSEGGNYLSAIKHNVSVITKGLKNE